MSTKQKAQTPTITTRYWIVLSVVSGVVALFPLAIVLVNYAANPSSNPFSELGYGAALWLLIISVPAGGIIFAVGALGAVAIEWIVARRRSGSR
jgi:hypothetical protein